MAFEQNLDTISMTAGADYTAGQYRACVRNSSGLAVLPSAGGRVSGVVQNKPGVGFIATVANEGITKMEAGGVIAAGAQVATGADGRAVAAITTGQIVIGEAVEAAGAAGVYFPMNIILGGNAIP